MIRRLLLSFGMLGLLSLASAVPLVSRSTATARIQKQRGMVSPDQRTHNLAEAALIAGLTQFRSLTIAGDYVAAGIGLRGVTQGSISITGIPADASIIEAYLYWGMLDNGESPSLKNINFNGSPTTGTLIGSGEDTCWGLSGSFVYRATVTSMVSGNGTFTLTGVASGGDVLAQGASLVVIYLSAGAPTRNVRLLDGDVVFRQPGVTANSEISGFLAAAPVSAKTTFIVGDGQAEPGETASFTGGAGAATFPNSFEGGDGEFWDTDTFVVSSQLSPGNTTATANIGIESDCLMWVAQAFSVTTTQPFDICIQDDSSGSLLKFNSTTGDYQFTNCAGLIIGGTGTLVTKGGIITLQHNGPDRRVLARIDKEVRSATASVQLFSQGTTFTITDRNTGNNSCSCPN